MKKLLLSLIAGLLMAASLPAVVPLPSPTHPEEPPFHGVVPLPSPTHPEEPPAFTLP